MEQYRQADSKNAEWQNTLPNSSGKAKTAPNGNRAATRIGEGIEMEIEAHYMAKFSGNIPIETLCFRTGPTS